MTVVAQYPPIVPEVTIDPVSALPFDAYRDIHKAIRAELFALTASAGSTDPSDRDARAALAAHLADVVALLVDHGRHEDTYVLPVLEEHAPSLFARNAADHEVIDAGLERLAERAEAITEAAPAEQRARVHNVYLDLASFTAAYLVHQNFEERIVMPALLDAVGVEGALGVHQAIVSSVPPPAMAKTLAVMVPAMNVDDRAELLGGMERHAPPEAFARVWGLTQSVLGPGEFRALSARLGRS